jgi:phosphonopyruvate decarboxylase
MIEAELFVDAARDRGFGLWSGVPCSYLTPFINYVIDAPGIRYVPAANEGDAVAIAAGSRLGGVPGIALFQNSGLGNAVNPLTSLTHTSRIPILIITTLRGEPGGPADEPQHALMGAITTSLLELMDIPWEYFPGEAEDVQPALDRALLHLNGSRSPYAFVMRKGGVSPYALRTGLEPRTLYDGTDASFTGPARESRRDLLRVIQTNVDPGLYRTRTLCLCGPGESVLHGRINGLRVQPGPRAGPRSIATTGHRAGWGRRCTDASGCHGDDRLPAPAQSGAYPAGQRDP